jgi:hypothetical protein
LAEAVESVEDLFWFAEVVGDVEVGKAIRMSVELHLSGVFVFCESFGEGVVDFDAVEDRREDDD